MNHVVNVCDQQLGGNFTGCMSRSDVQIGGLFQIPGHFWALQWGEAGCFVAAAAFLLGLTVWSVRRWRA